MLIRAGELGGPGRRLSTSLKKTDISVPSSAVNIEPLTPGIPPRPAHHHSVYTSMPEMGDERTSLDKGLCKN